MCALYRHPVLLARTVMDVDRISKGRMVLGMGIGNNPAEFQALGLPFLSARERQEVEAIAYFQGLIQSGMQYFILGVSLHDRETLELLRTEIWPALKVN